MKFGDIGSNVREYKKDLIRLGANLLADDVFDIATYVATKAFQENMGLTADGWAGPVTVATAKSAPDGSAIPKPKPTIPVEPIKPTQPPTADEPKPETPKPVANWYNAIWVGPAVADIGKTEFSHDKYFAAYWKYVGLPQFKTVIGTDHAWCALFIEKCFRDVQMIGSKSAMAVSYKTFGIPTVPADDYWFGSLIHIKHPGGGNHVTIFLWWVDKAKGLAACLGGNQSNACNITIYRIAPGYESNPGGPRWPAGHPKGRVVTEAEGKLLIKNAGYVVGGSTR